MDDDIKVIVNSDNTITIEWDESDPKWSFLNDLTEQEFSALLSEGIQKIANSTND